MLSWIFRALRLGGVLTSPQAAPSGLQMTPPSHPGTENPRKPGSPDFILIVKSCPEVVMFIAGCHSLQYSVTVGFKYYFVLYRGGGICKEEAPTAPEKLRDISSPAEIYETRTSH